MVNRTRYRNELGQIDAVRPSSGGITLTIDHTKVSDDLTNFPVYVNLNDVKSGITLTEAQSIRIYDSSNNELAREIVSKDEMHFKAGSLSSTVDTTFNIVMDGVSSDYGVTTTYGRNNVWTDYVAVYHMEGNSNDSTGNGWNGTDTSVSYVSGKVGQAGSFNGTTSKTLISASDMIPTTAGQKITISSWINPSTNQLTNQQPINLREGFIMSYGHGGEAYRGATVFADSSLNYYTSGQTTLSTSTDYYIVSTYDGNALIRHNNGSLFSSQSIGSKYRGASGSNYIGCGASLLSFYGGTIDEVRIASNTFTDSRISTEYNNQSSPSTFYTIS